MRFVNLHIWRLTYVSYCVPALLGLSGDAVSVEELVIQLLGADEVDVDEELLVDKPAGTAVLNDEIERDGHEEENANGTVATKGKKRNKKDEKREHGCDQMATSVQMKEQEELPAYTGGRWGGW